MCRFIDGGVRRPKASRIAQTLLAALLIAAGPARLAATTIFFSGDLRTDANFTNCGSGCTLGPSNTDADYAQWAAAVYSFTVYTTTAMEAITYSYGGGTSLTGAVVPSGGLEPYLSLFDASGDFIASTFSGTICPSGANFLNGNCFDVELNGGALSPGTYQIAVTDFENMSLAENNGLGNLSDGFTGLGVLQSGENLNFAFDVVLPNNVTPVPEPASLAMLAIGCAVLAVRKRKSRIRRSIQTYIEINGGSKDEE